MGPKISTEIVTKTKEVVILTKEVMSAEYGLVLSPYNPSMVQLLTYSLIIS